MFRGIITGVLRAVGSGAARRSVKLAQSQPAPLMRPPRLSVMRALNIPAVRHPAAAIIVHDDWTSHVRADMRPALADYVAKIEAAEAEALDGDKRSVAIKKVAEHDVLANQEMLRQFQNLTTVQMERLDKALHECDHFFAPHAHEVKDILMRHVAQNANVKDIGPANQTLNQIADMLADMVSVLPYGQGVDQLLIDLDKKGLIQQFLRPDPHEKDERLNIIKLYQVARKNYQNLAAVPPQLRDVYSQIMRRTQRDNRQAVLKLIERNPYSANAVLANPTTAPQVLKKELEEQEKLAASKNTPAPTPF